jgi:hypothetical protein
MHQRVEEANRALSSSLVGGELRDLVLCLLVSMLQTSFSSSPPYEEEAVEVSCFRGFGFRALKPACQLTYTRKQLPVVHLSFFRSCPEVHLTVEKKKL